MYEHLTRPQLNELLQDVEEQIWNAREFLAGLEAQSGVIRGSIRALGSVALTDTYEQNTASQMA